MFDQNKFTAAQFEPNTKDVELKELAPFFDEGEAPILTVRGLTFSELGEVNSAMQVSRNISKVYEAISPDTQTEESTALIQEALGIFDKDTDPIIVRKIEMVRIGTSLNRETIIAIGKRYPISMDLLINEISILTSEGMVLTEKKPNSSGQTPE